MAGCFVCLKYLMIIGTLPGTPPSGRNILLTPDIRVGCVTCFTTWNVRRMDTSHI